MPLLRDYCKAGIAAQHTHAPESVNLLVNTPVPAGRDRDAGKKYKVPRGTSYEIGIL